jgi:hypothetical protein
MRVRMRRRSSHACAAGADLPTGLPAHRVTPATQARKQVLELCQFDLGLALAALGVLTEDVEDDRRTVDHLDLHDILEGAPLAGRELGVGDHGVGADRCDDVAQLLRLAAADVCRGVRVRPALQHRVEDDRTRGLRESGELAKRILGILLLTLGVDADQHHVLETQLPVLDLGDVLELGREPRDAPECRALFAIPLLAVGIGARSGGGLVLQCLGIAEYAYPGACVGTREHAIHRVHRHLVGALGGRRIGHVFLSGATALSEPQASRSVGEF